MNGVYKIVKTQSNNIVSIGFLSDEAKILVRDMVYDYMCNGIPTSKYSKSSSGESLDSKYAGLIPQTSTSLDLLKQAHIDTHVDRSIDPKRGKYCGAYNGLISKEDCMEYLDDLQQEGGVTLNFVDYFRKRGVIPDVDSNSYRGEKYSSSVDRTITRKKNPNEDLRSEYNKFKSSDRLNRNSQARKTKQQLNDIMSSGYSSKPVSKKVYDEDDRLKVTRVDPVFEIGNSTLTVLIVINVIVLIYGKFVLAQNEFVSLQIIAIAQLFIANIFKKAMGLVGAAGICYEMAFIFNLLHNEQAEQASMTMFWFQIGAQVFIYLLDKIKK